MQIVNQTLATNSNLQQQGTTPIVDEVNKAIKLLAKDYKEKTGKVFELISSYKSEYDIFDELIPRVKHLPYNGSKYNWPLKKGFEIQDDDDENDTTLYRDVKAAINGINDSSFNPPLKQGQTTIGEFELKLDYKLYRAVPSKIGTDVRQSGRHVEITKQTISNDLDWFINNACLRGFVVYGIDGLYYLGKAYLESIVNDVPLHQSIQRIFIPAKLVVVPSKTVSTPTGSAGTGGTSGTGTSGTGAGGTGTGGLGATPTGNPTSGNTSSAPKVAAAPKINKIIKPDNYTNTSIAYTNNPNISALRNAIVKNALQAAQLGVRNQTPFFTHFTDIDHKYGNALIVPDANLTNFEKQLKAVGWYKTPYFSSRGTAYWNNDYAAPIQYRNLFDKKANGKSDVGTVKDTKGLIDVLSVSTAADVPLAKDKNGVLKPVDSYVSQLSDQSPYSKDFPIDQIGKTKVKASGPTHYCAYSICAWWLQGYKDFKNNQNIKYAEFLNIFKNNNWIGGATGYPPIGASTNIWNEGAMKYRLDHGKPNAAYHYKDGKLGFKGPTKKNVDPRFPTFDAPDIRQLEPGDAIVVANAAHIQMVVKVNYSAGTYETVGGNESKSGIVSGNTPNLAGNGVYHKLNAPFPGGIITVIKVPTFLT